MIEIIDKRIAEIEEGYKDYCNPQGRKFSTYGHKYWSAKDIIIQELKNLQKNIWNSKKYFYLQERLCIFV